MWKTNKWYSPFWFDNDTVLRLMCLKSRRKTETLMTVKLIWLDNVNSTGTYKVFKCILTYIHTYIIWHSEDRASWYILIIKPKRCIDFSNLFWNITLHVSNRFSVHHQESSTVHTAIGIRHTGYADCLLARSQQNLYDIYLLLCVQY